MMKNRFIAKIFIKLFLIAASVFLLSTCGNLLKIGMGDEIDLEPPSNSLVSPVSGSFINGSVVFEGTVSDDQQVANVEISFDRGTTWTTVEFDQASWSFGYNTLQTADGRLAVLIRATDANGKISTSEEYLFSVDNTAPVVMISSPREYDQLSFNTSATLTVAATDVYQIENFQVDVQAATIPGDFEPGIDDPDTLSWGSVSGFPKQINQSASPLSYEFNSLPFTTDIGAPHRFFRFAFRAQDEAGNVSSEFFHIDEIADVNNNQLLTVDQIADILDGENYTNSFGTVITAAVLNGISRSASSEPILMEFDEDTNLPRAGVSFPTSETAALPTMKSTNSIQGYFEDDDGIDTATMALLIEKADDYDEATHTVSSWTTVMNNIPPADYELNSEMGARRIDWSQPVDAFGQGVYRITVDVQDVAGADRPTDFNMMFMISDGPPDLEINSPDNLNFNDTIILTGTASHSIAINSIEVKLGYGTTASPTWVFEGLSADYDGATGEWLFDTSDSSIVDFDLLLPSGGLSNLPEGEVLVRVTANGETAKHIFLYRDVAVPVLTFDRPEDNSQLNTDAVINGAADDDSSGMYDLEVLISHPDDPKDPATAPPGDWYKKSEAPVLGIDGGEFGPSLASWRFTFDSEDYTDNNITFYIKGTDRAGNSAVVSRDFEIYQDSDLPVISLSNIDAAGTRFDNVLAGEPRFLGYVTDDDSVDPDTFRYRVKKPDTTWGDWVYPYAPGEKDPTTRLDFNIPIYAPGTVSTPLGEGSHEVQLWAEDTGGIGISRDGAETGSLMVAFSVDGNPPAVGLTGPFSGSIHNQNFNITGAVTDGFGIEEVKLSFDGGTTYPKTLYTYDGISDPNTLFTIDLQVVIGTDIPGDGTYNLRIRALDMSGSSATENTTVIIDTDPPDITLYQPVALDTVNDLVTISGIVEESLQMDSAWYWIGTEGTPSPAYTVSDPADNGWIEFSDSRNLSAGWNSYAAQEPAFTVQNYTVHIIARDLAGNWSTELNRTVTADQGSDRPELEYTNINTAGTGMPAIYGTAPDNLFGANAVLNGTTGDDDGINGTDVLISTRSYNWETGLWSGWSGWNTVSSPFDGIRTNGSWSDNISTLGEGVHQVMIRVLDENFSGTLADDDTVADHPDLFKWNQSDAVGFAIDTRLPDVTINSPADGSYINSSFTITGTASDANRLLEWDPGTGMTDYILVLENDGADWSGAVEAAVDGATDEWIYSVDIDAGGDDDGPKIWQVRATDRMGNESTYEYNFTIDTEPPVTAIASLYPTIEVGADDHVNGDLYFSASASDNNNIIQQVKYWLLKSNGDDGPAPEEATFDVGGTEIFSPYNVDINTNLNDDETYYTLYIGSEDRAGNISIVSREIYINQASDTPTFSYTNVDSEYNTLPEASLNLLETGARIIGAVSDDDGVDKDSIMATVYNSDDSVHTALGPVSNRPSENGTYLSWTHDLSALPDGVYYVRFEAADINGLSVISDPLYFTVDLNPAALDISFPETGSYHSTDFNISGTASDENGLLHGDHDGDGGAVTAETDYLQIHDGTSWNNVEVTAGSWSYPVSAPADHSNDGAKSYQIKATDVFGKSTTETVGFTIDTQDPVLNVASPSVDLWTSEDILSVSGTSSDTGGVAAVKASLDNTEWTSLNGTTAWSGLLDLGSLSEQLNAPVYFKSTDNAGNSAYDTILINIDRSAPIVEETGINTSSTVYRDSDYTLSGTLSDNLSGSLPVYDHDADGGTPDVEYVELSVNSAAPFKVPVNAGEWSYGVSFSSGVFIYDISVADRAGNSSGIVTRTVYADNSAPSLDSITSPDGTEPYISGSSYSIAGTASDTGSAGLDAVYWWAGNEGASAPSTAFPYTGWNTANGLGSWTGSVNLTALGEGNKTLHVFAVDNSGISSAAVTRDFTVDQAAPYLIEDGLGGASINASGDISLEVSIVESNGIALGDHDNDGGTDDVEYFELMINGSDWAADARMIEYTGANMIHAVTEAELSDGSNVLLLRATDLAGRVSTEIRRDVFFDNTPPDISFINVNPASVVNGESFTVQGTATDTASVISSVTIAVNGPGDGGFGAEQPVNGSVYSWSYDLDLTPSGTYYADAPISIRVTAADGAGNTSQEILTFNINQQDDMPVLNLSGLATFAQPATAEVTADNKVLAGVLLDADGVDLDSLIVTVDSGIRTARVINGSDDDQAITWFVDLSDKAAGSYPYSVAALDTPGNVVEGNNSGMLGSDIPVLGLSAKITGSAEDDDSFDASSLTLLQNGIDLSGSLTVSGDSTYVPWSYSLPADDNVYFFEVNGTDATAAAIPVDWAKYGGETVKTMVVKDSGAPAVNVNSPSQGAYINGTVVTSGSAGDDLAVNTMRITAVQSDNITSVELTSDPGVALDTSEGGEFYYDTAAAEWVWNFALERLPDAYENDSITLVYEAEDIVGNSTVKERSVTVDTVEPIIAINSPGNGNVVNGNVTFQGTVSDVKLSTVELKLGTGNYELLSGGYNWSKEYSAATMISYATDLGDGTYELPVYVKATDSAGNTGFSDAYSIIINPDTDKPIVNMTSPDNNSTLGGTIMLVGSAIDDDAVDSVELRIDFNGDGDFNDIIDLNDDGDTDDDFETESSWVTVTNFSNGIWNKEINTLGELYKSNIDDKDDVISGNETIDNIATGDITVQIHAWDINFTESLVTTLSITLDETFPEITDFSVIGDPAAISGTFDLQWDIIDNEEITSVTISYDGGLTYTDTIYDGSGTISTLTGSKTVDSETDLGLSDLSSTVNVRMKAVDNTGYVSFSNLTVNIDNVAPTGTYTGRIEEIGTGDVWVAGNAVDTGAVRGIDKIEVYIIQDGNLIELEADPGTPLVPETFDFGEGGVPYTTDTDYKIVIDNHEEVDLPAVDDGDGYWELMSVNGNAIEWQARFDSSAIDNSNPLQVHFVIWDNAGNAVHYVETMMMVGTDLDENGTVDEDEMVAYPQGFKATDLLKVEMDPGDNTELYIYIEHDSSEVYDGSDYASGTTERMSGTIDISSYDEGNTSFEIEVRDGTATVYTVIVQKTLYVEIVGADTTPPTVTLNQLSQASIVDGHLENNSNYNGADFDVSGTVTFNVNANDNSRIQTINMIVEAEDNSVMSNLEIASWNGGLFEAKNGAVFTKNELSWQDGHDVILTIDWDSSTITGTADENVEVRFVATDFKDYTGEDSDNFDVVPFISGIDRGTSFNTYRSRFGYYSIKRGTDNLTDGLKGDTIRIFGYNLYNSALDTVSFGSSADVTLSSPVTDVPDTDPHLSVQVPVDATSGELLLTVNGLAAINNLNSNNESYHSEANGYIQGSDEWTDDRYIHIWQSADNNSGANRGYFEGSDDPVYPAMTIEESTGVLYSSWSNYAESDVMYGSNNGTVNSATIFHSYDPLEHTDIDFGNRPTVVYNANTYGNGTWDEDGAGGVYVWDSQVSYGNDGSTTGDYYNSEELWHDQMLMQFINQRVVNDGDNIHISYFDTETKAVKYHYIRSNDQTEGEIESWINLDGGYDEHDYGVITLNCINYPWNGRPDVQSVNVSVDDVVTGGQVLVNLDNGDTITAPTGGTVTRIYVSVGDQVDNEAIIDLTTDRVVERDQPARSASAGEYSAIDVQTNGNPVVAYYDSSQQTVRLAVSSANNPSAADWTLMNVIDTEDTNYQYSGKYISMIIDSNNDVHLVFYRNSTGDLVYMKSTEDPINNSGYVFGDSVIIDSIGSVGAWADITLDESGNPVISYLDSSRAETFDGLKMAYWNIAESDWEYMNVPLGFEISNYRTSVEYDIRTGASTNPDTWDWEVAVGYSSGDYYRIAYYIP